MLKGRVTSYACKRFSDDQLIALSEQELAAMKEEAEEVYRENQQIKATQRGMQAKLILDAIALYGDKSLPVKYLQKQPLPYISNECRWTDFEHKVKQAKANRVKELQATEAGRKSAELTEKAIAWLIERGQKIGEDFNLENAADTANHIAYDEEVARRIKEIAASDIFVSFCGEDNCENCAGWDGESRRCDCTNRRVYWERSYGHTFLSPSIEAVAY